MPASLEPSVMRRLLAPLREFGPLAGSAYLVDRALRKLFAKVGLYLYDIMLQPVLRDALLPPRLTRNLQFIEIGPGHPDLSRMPAREDVKALRFQQGARCLAVYRKESFVGYIWFCFHGYDEDEVRCSYDLSRVGPAAWDFDLYVFPKHRIALGFSAVWHGAFEYLSSRGIERSFSRVSRFNSASRRAHARLGSVRVGTVFIAKFWRIEVACASVAPRFGVSWSSRPRYVLDRSSPAGHRAIGSHERSDIAQQIPAGPKS